MGPVDSDTNRASPQREDGPPPPPLGPHIPLGSRPRPPWGRIVLGAAAVGAAALALAGVFVSFAASTPPAGLLQLVQEPLVLRKPAPMPAAAIAARADPAIVDINVTLAYGQGQVAGTGMILTASGEVLTNNHVVAGAGTIRVTVPDRGTYPARVLGVDPTDDVALLQLEGPSGLPTIPLGQSQTVGVGSGVVAIGNALGLGGTPAVTAGVVTAEGQDITATGYSVPTEHLTNMLEMDAALEPGDSGGPLLNRAGQVIGMDTAGQTATGSTLDPVIGGSAAPMRAGFAIPIDRALRIARAIADGHGSATILLKPQGFLGVEMVNPSSLRAGEERRLGVTRGAVVVRVLPNTPAAGTSLSALDVVVAVDGAKVTNIQSLNRLIKARRPGSRITVTWVTPAHTQQSATVTLITAPVA